jgi:hypothetical protein
LCGRASDGDRVVSVQRPHRCGMYVLQTRDLAAIENLLSN